MVNYTLITKPGIIMGNLITVLAGFLLGSQGYVDFLLLAETLLGLALIIASACVFNNYIDRVIDTRMERTKKRALATGSISVAKALTFGVLLGIAGAVVLLTLTNAITFLVTAVGFGVYVLLYSMWKPHTVYATAIGSIAGAVPPVAGYTSACNSVDAGALALFVILVLWQMPHFHSIAVFRMQDYAKANIPVLPVVKGMRRTKIHMFLYIAAFIPAALMLTVLGYTGLVYFTVISAIGCLWLGLCFKGFFNEADQQWGRQMFYVSLLMICALSMAIPFDSI